MQISPIQFTRERKYAFYIIAHSYNIDGNQSTTLTDKITITPMTNLNYYKICSSVRNVLFTQLELTPIADSAQK